MAEKIDRRVRKTRNQLKNGLAQLMMEKNINEITVKELVETVDINRSTFYLHYSDIYNLLEVIEDEILQEIQTLIDENPMGVEDNTFLFMEGIFTVLHENRDICMALLGENGDATFVHKMSSIIEKNAMQQLEMLFPDIKDELHYTFSFCMSGSMGIVKQWLFENNGDTPENIAKLVFKMVMHALGLSRKYEKTSFLHDKE